MGGLTCHCIALVLSSVIVESADMHREQKFRLRVILSLIILATIPCYCVGLVLVRASKSLVAEPTATLSSTATTGASPSPTQFSTHTIAPSLTATPSTPTSTASLTPTVFSTWTPTATLSHTPTTPNTATFTPTNTQAPPTITVTITPIPPTDTPFSPADTETPTGIPDPSPQP